MTGSGPLRFHLPGSSAGSRLTLAGLLALAGVLGCASFDDAREASYATPRRGMVVSEHQLATAAGTSILERGGNAADAAVATALALAVVLPRAGNLAGGGFAIWVAHDPAVEPLALDFRETAPRGLRREHFLDASGNPVPSRSLRTSLGVGVPGSAAGLWALQQKLGVLSFASVAAPAIELAQVGYRVGARFAASLRKDSTQALLKRGGTGAELFYPGGQPLAEGDLLLRPQLAKTLERLARLGPPGFYRGRVAKAIVDAVQADGGVLDLEDLEAYAPVWREPLRGWFRGLEIVTVPPPSSGGLVLLQVLSLLDGFPLDEELARAEAQSLAMGHVVGEESLGLSARGLHWWIEVMRRAFADRAEHMGDPDYHDVPVGELLAPEWIAERRISIGEFADPSIGPLELAGFKEGGDTTHISVIDRDGNALSLTTTLNTSFGCGLVVPETGLILNNELDDFALHAGVPNAYGLVGSQANALEPGKRPLSSMTPTIVRDGGRVVSWVLGGAGGPRIITSLIQVFLRCEVYGQSLGTAMAAPRLHQQWSPTLTRLESGWDGRLLQGLRDRRHMLEESSGIFGVIQAIRIPVGGEPEGASDPRRGGAVGVER